MKAKEAVEILQQAAKDLKTDDICFVIIASDPSCIAFRHNIGSHMGLRMMLTEILDSTPVELKEGTD